MMLSERWRNVDLNYNKHCPMDSYTHIMCHLLFDYLSRTLKINCFQQFWMSFLSKADYIYRDYDIYIHY